MTRPGLAAAVHSLHAEGFDKHQIAARLHYSPQYISELLRDPEGLEAKRRYWRGRTPLQRAVSGLEPIL